MKGKHQEEYLRNVLNAFDDQVFVLNHLGQLRDSLSAVNQSTNKSKNAHKGKWIQELFPIDLCARMLDGLWKIIRKEESRIRFEYQDQDNGEQWFSVYLKALDKKKKTGDPEVLLVMRDLSHLAQPISLNSALKNRHDELQRLNTKKDEVLSVLSHDLRSPMNSMLGLLNLIRAEGKDVTDKQLKKYHSLLETNARKMESLVEDVLSWSSVNFKEEHYQPSRLNWKEEIEGVLEGLVSAAHKQIELRNEVKKKHYVYADRGVIRSILRNLLSNAIKFSNPGDTITIRCASSEKHFILEVIDQGIGMSDDRVFALLNSELTGVVHGTSGEKGTGMGIEMVKRFAQRCGGKLEIISKPGKGSTFRVVFPVLGNEK